MILFKNNVFTDPRFIDEDDLLQQFANSEDYQDKTRDEKVRLALFIAGTLQSTFYGYQFNKLFDKWCCEKYKYVEMSKVKSQMEGEANVTS